jgi:hypothetical protein
MARFSTLGRNLIGLHELFKLHKLRRGPDPYLSYCAIPVLTCMFCLNGDSNWTPAERLVGGVVP